MSINGIIKILHTPPGKIPKTIYYTSPTSIPDSFELTRLINTNNKLGYDGQLYDDSKCLEFIQDYFDKRVVRCYQQLIPGAFKADLWRYCKLYIDGGIYIDLGMELKMGLDKLVEDYDVVVVKDSNYFSEYCLWNGFIITYPKNKLFLYVIDVICSKIEKLDKGKNIIDLTGPSVFGEVFCNYYNTSVDPGEKLINNTKIKILQIDFNKKVIKDINNEEILFCHKYHFKDTYNEEMSKLKTKDKYIKDKPCTHYSYLWDNNFVFKILHNSNNVIKPNNFYMDGKYLVVKCKTNKGKLVENKILFNYDMNFINKNGIILPKNISFLNNISTKIPKIIFQTHKSNQYLKMHKKLLNATNSWKKHSEFKYNFYNDKQQADFMKTYFGDIYDVYCRLPLSVMKADLWRYCIIYKYGGIYADSDTVCLSKPDYLVKNALLNCAPEIDVAYYLRAEKIRFDVHLCQWVFAAPANCPVIKSIIDLSVKRIRKTYIIKGEHIVHYLTGPGVFTDGINKWLTKNSLPIFKNSTDYTFYPKNILYIHDASFHKNKVKHLYSGGWENGWIKQRDKLLL